jgi:putative ABC transport system permease protein
MQSSRPGGTLAVRTAAEPRGIARSVHAAVQGLDKDIPVTDVRTMQQIAAETFAQPRLHTWLIGIFAAFALALAALGIYGVISYSLAHRIHEMGIRMALGAHPGDLLRTTVGSAAVMVLLGLGLGLAGSLALARVLQTLLFEVQPTDPLTYIAVSALLLAVGLVAAYLPARRGVRVDPAAALRLD